MPNIDAYKLEQAAVNPLEEKLDLINAAEQKTGADLDKQFKAAVEALDAPTLANFLDKQFKDGDKYKNTDLMQSDDTYTFLVQASLDAVSQNNRYENLLRGDAGKYGVDNMYGPRTRAAVKQFQRDAGIEEDGVVWPKTMAVLVEVLKGNTKLDFTKALIEGAEIFDAKKLTEATDEFPAKKIEDIKTGEHKATVVKELDGIQSTEKWTFKDGVLFDGTIYGPTGNVLVEYKDGKEVKPDVEKPVSKAVVDASGKLLVDAYGNAVNYVDDKAKIPSANFNKPEFGNNVYEYKWFRVFGNGRVMNTSTSEMFDWNDLDAKIAAGSTNTGTVKTDTIPVSTDKFGEKVFESYVEDIKARYTLDAVRNIAKGNPIAASFATNELTRVYFEDSNPNVTIKYSRKGDGSNKYELGSINVRNFISSSSKDYAILDKKILSLMEEAGKKRYYGDQLDATIRSSSYTLAQLFPDKVNDDGYKAYFNLFDDSKVVLDTNKANTKIATVDGKLVLQFDLDDSWWDEKYNDGLTIPLDNIIDNQKLSAAKFKQELQKIIKHIIDSHADLFGTA